MRYILHVIEPGNATIHNVRDVMKFSELRHQCHTTNKRRYIVTAATAAAEVAYSIHTKWSHIAQSHKAEQTYPRQPAAPTNDFSILLLAIRQCFYPAI